MVVYFNRTRLPRFAIVFKVADEFLLLAVDTYDRIARRGELVPAATDIDKLLIAILRGKLGWRFQPLAVYPQRKVHCLQQLRHGVGTNINADFAQLAGDLFGAFASPSQAAHRASGHLVLHQLFNPVDYFRRFFSAVFRPPPRRRTRSGLTCAPNSSRRPLATVWASMSRNSAILESPPCPSLCDSRPAYNRRCFSSRRL